MKTELKALFRIIKFFAEVVALLAFGWIVIIASWAIFGN